MPLTIVSRERWGAREAEIEGFPLSDNYPLPKVVLTCTNTPPCYGTECVRDLRRLQNKHMDKQGLPDIKYNFMVGSDGIVYEGAGWNKSVYWANKDHSPVMYKSITVALMDDLEDKPTRAAYSALKKLLTLGVRKQRIKMPIDFVNLPGDA